MKKYSTLLILTFLFMVVASTSAFAEEETKIETEQGGYLTLTNIDKEIRLNPGGPHESRTAYISDGAVTLTIIGDDPSASIRYHGEAEIYFGSFIPSEEKQSIEMTGNAITLSEPGFYSGFVYFGMGFSPSNTAPFVIKVGDGQPTVMSTFNIGDADSGYSLQLPNVLKFQRIQGSDVKHGEIDMVVPVLKAPDLSTSQVRLGQMIYTFETNDPNVNRASLKFVSRFGGLVGTGDAKKIIDGSYTSSIPVSPSEIKNDIVQVSVRAYDDSRERGDTLVFDKTGVNFIFEGFEREGFTLTDVNQEEEPIATENVSAKPTSSAVLVDGKNVSFQAYNIKGNNYFKLRDLAMVLSGTEKSFEVGWDADNNAISLESGKEYTAVGGELVVSGKPATELGKLSTSTIYLDGEEVELTAYLINGNNYFKLRDVASVIDFGVTWNSETNTVGIDSSSEYIPK